VSIPDEVGAAVADVGPALTAISSIARDVDANMKRDGTRKDPTDITISPHCCNRFL
jgi:hypothetical protein